MVSPVVKVTSLVSPTDQPFVISISPFIALFTTCPIVSHEHTANGANGSGAAYTLPKQPKHIAAVITRVSIILIIFFIRTPFPDSRPFETDFTAKKGFFCPVSSRYFTVFLSTFRELILYLVNPLRVCIGKRVV